MTLASPLRTIRRFRAPKPLVILGGVVVVALLLFGLRQCLPHKATDPYRTGAVTRGDITRSVSASGTLEALVTVQVGSQVSGQIKQVLVDFNSTVKKGQLLATIDPQTYTSRVQQSQADVSASDAGLAQQQAQADVAKANYQRTLSLYRQGIAAKAALDQDEAVYKAAQASVQASRAKITQSRASLASSQLDLGRTQIVSPIDGVVVNRQIDPGQTVQASFSAPTLFQIAQDLSKLQVKIMVDEADIGQVRQGQAVNFTVDAFPDRTFTGVVTQVRKQPETQSNVVAYAVIAEADNPGGTLLPGMTANADIIIQKLTGVLKVPVAALRFTPADQQPPATPGGPPGGGAGGPPAGGAQGPGGGARGGGGGFASRIVSQLGLTGDQKTKADAIFADMQTQTAAAGGDRDARRKLIADAFAKLEPILTPDQKSKLAVMRARTGAGGGRGAPNAVVWVLRKDKPVAVPVRSGASDGSFTEVSGALQPGDEVIVGGGPKAKIQLRRGASPFGGGVRVRM